MELAYLKALATEFDIPQINVSVFTNFWIKSQERASQSSWKDPHSKHTFNNISKIQQEHKAWGN